MKKIIVFSLFTFFALVMGIFLWVQFHKGEPKLQDFKVQVKSYEVGSEIIHDKVEALGTTFANESVNITPNVSELIAELKFEEGDLVKKGEIIVILDQAEEQAQKEAQIAQVNEHKRELKRLENLLKVNATAQNAFDERKTKLAIAQYFIEETNARIEDRTIRAPFDGILGLRKVSVGSLVEPGTLITTIDDLSRIKLDFTVPTTFLSVLKEGTQILATSTSYDETFKGTVSNIDTRADPITRAVLIRAILPNPELKIKPGILMTVVLLKNEREAIVVPEESILQIQDDHFVFVIENPKEPSVHQKRVEIGLRMPGKVEILSGLKQKDLIVRDGISKVRDGQKIIIQPET
ncbi:MAG TPA: efflux RND transporter periplasmic adaptor subunit [Gammaproteobacteria bacterium]|nr:efflux RND transporter periplasmic adaptor subunit [Gammaproteobacteria bacterium]